jgi:hypothetical protein
LYVISTGASGVIEGLPNLRFLSAICKSRILIFNPLVSTSCSHFIISSALLYFLASAISSSSGAFILTTGLLMLSFFVGIFGGVFVGASHSGLVVVSTLTGILFSLVFCHHCVGLLLLIGVLEILVVFVPSISFLYCKTSIIAWVSCVEICCHLFIFSTILLQSFTFLII